MIQFVRWQEHPRGKYAGSYKGWDGWFLLSDWEVKIDFLEQLIILNRSPDDIEKPWRRAIWERMFHNQELQERQREREYQKWLRMEGLEADECPLQFSCKVMSGAIASTKCSNFQECRRVRSIL
jgi:hypothetical protein